MDIPKTFFQRFPWVATVSERRDEKLRAWVITARDISEAFSGDAALGDRDLLMEGGMFDSGFVRGMLAAEAAIKLAYRLQEVTGTKWRLDEPQKLIANPPFAPS